MVKLERHRAGQGCRNAKVPTFLLLLFFLSSDSPRASGTRTSSRTKAEASSRTADLGGLADMVGILSDAEEPAAPRKPLVVSQKREDAPGKRGSSRSGSLFSSSSSFLATGSSSFSSSGPRVGERLPGRVVHLPQGGGAPPEDDDVPVLPVLPGEPLVGRVRESALGQEAAEEEEGSRSGLSLLARLRHLPVGGHDHDHDHEHQGRKLTLAEAAPFLLLSLLAGLSTTLGALVVLCLPENDQGGPHQKVIAFSLALAAGVMLTVSVLELWPKGEGVNIVFFLTFASGGLLCFLLCKLADWILTPPDGSKSIFQSPDSSPAGATRAADAEVGRPLQAGSLAAPAAAEKDQRRSKRLALLLFLSLTAHNFPEGFAVAVSAFSSMRLGVVIAIAIAVHNIPEGIAICVSDYAATQDKWHAVMMASASGLTEPLGALVAVLLLQQFITPHLLELLLVFVAGIMCYVAIVELLPAALKAKEPGLLGLGLATGILVMAVTSLLV